MKKSFFSVLIIFSLILISCGDQQPSADEIMAQSIKAHGGDLVANAQVDFIFRGINYNVARDSGFFIYERRFEQDGKPVVDRLDNEGFTRSINDTLVALDDKLRARYTSSLNSVIYFAQLPYGLDGEAVNLTYIGMDSINNSNYHEIQVTFKEDGGGEDHEDVFVYWIDTQDFLVDYMAYSYCEDDCGFRFRESVNRRNINGIVVQDYNNYKSNRQDPKLEDLDDAFQASNLELLSEIKTEFAKVTLTKN